MTRPTLKSRREDALKLSEFAAMLGISTKTARRWIASGQVEAVQTPGGHWRVPASQLEARDLTVSQVARLLGVHPITVRRWCRTDKITHTETPGGYYRIPMSEVPRIGRRRRTQ